MPGIGAIYYYAAVAVPPPPQNKAAFDLTPANEPHTHIYSQALSMGGGAEV
jgi:hypothetical protein